MLFFGSCAGDPAFEAMVANLVGLVEGAPDEILAATSLTAEELERGLADFREWSRLGDAAMRYATSWAEGRRPEEGPAAGRDAPTRPASRPRAKVSSMELLVASAADLSSSLELDEVMRKIAERIQGMVDCHLFGVMLWNEETELLEHTYSVRYGEHVPQEGGFPLGHGLSGSAAKLRRAIRVPDVSQDPRYIRFRHAEVEIKSELAMPLVVRDRLVGALDLESTELDAFTEEHEQIVTALASQIATALENARLYGRVVANEQRLEEDLSTAREIQRGLLPAEPPQLRGFEIGAAMEESRHEQRELQLAPGDVVVFCSDGLDDCLNEAGETFGTVCLPDDLRRAAPGSAIQIAEALIEACGGFAGPGWLVEDDRTVVVVKATPTDG